MIGPLICKFKGHKKLYWTNAKCEEHGAMTGDYRPYYCPRCGYESPVFRYPKIGLKGERMSNPYYGIDLDKVIDFAIQNAREGSEEHEAAKRMKRSEDEIKEQVAELLQPVVRPLEPTKNASLNDLIFRINSLGWGTENGNLLYPEGQGLWFQEGWHVAGEAGIQCCNLVDIDGYVSKIPVLVIRESEAFTESFIDATESKDAMLEYLKKRL